MSDQRLIEVEFPLRQTSLDSVHEKNVRHGHLSTLHIWPARRPLAASRAVVLATLLSCPEDLEERHALVERIGGNIQKTVKNEKKNGETVQSIKEETVGSITRWLGTPPKTGKKAIEDHRKLVQQRESELEFFRNKIREAYGGRPPRVLDPFSGGGAIPLEAMRLGCETFAVDINPVSCFILRATLEYPQRLAGKTWQLPKFAFGDAEFMKDFIAAHPQYAPVQQKSLIDEENERENIIQADLAWQVRAWGRHVLAEARKELGKFYPTYAEFEPYTQKGAYPYEPVPPKLVPLAEDGTPNIKALNRDFSTEYLADPGNARWVEKPTVAYLWARTCQCSSCRAEIPLLKTKWLCKKDGKRVLLTVTPNDDKSGVIFGVQENVPVVGENSRKRKEHDAEIGKGCMSRTGVTCPCCGATMTMNDLRNEGKAGRLGMIPTAVVYEQTNVDGKRYRLPTEEEICCAKAAESELDRVYADIPYGIPKEPTPSEDALGMRIPKYGFSRWCDLFTPRQLLALGVFCKEVRKAMSDCLDMGYSQDLAEAIGTYLTITFDKTADYNSTIATWILSQEHTRSTFTRFALPMTWDYAELAILNNICGSYTAQLEWVVRFLDENLIFFNSKLPIILNQSSIQLLPKDIDCIITDPPYYDAIPYSDCMDFFYVWLRRSITSTVLDNNIFKNSLGPKWDKDKKDGELIDDPSRHDGDRTVSKKIYEDGMAKVFERCHEALTNQGRLVIVFANKQSEAWETLVSAIIRAGFMVTASWPISTERSARMRANASAALSSSVWLVCKKRGFSRPGWDSTVLEEMRSNITEKLHDFWDAGVRGPDFVWAATGPALTAYSSYPIVKKADSSGVMTVSEFLAEVRRIVVEFVVGQVLKGENAGTNGKEELDSVTSYYLLHRNDFGFSEAPAGACILYATACGLSDSELASTWNLIKMSDNSLQDDSESDFEIEESNDSGGKLRLKKWNERKHASLGLEGRNGRPVPIIDCIHKLMHLWESGDQNKVDEFIDSFALHNNDIFHRVIQSLIELSEKEERTILESISNHIKTYNIKTSNLVQNKF